MSQTIIGRSALARRFLVGLAILAATFAPELVASSASAAVDVQGILAAHNQERAAFGFQDPMSGSNIWPLAWSTGLSTYAQNKADDLARNRHYLWHDSPNLQSLNQGENLAVALDSRPDTQFVALWTAEKRFFMFGMPLEQSSTTGDWRNVGHYTQMIWYSTTSVGCGRATGSVYVYTDANRQTQFPQVDANGQLQYPQGAIPRLVPGTFFACRYQPAGNIRGQSPTGHTNAAHPRWRHRHNRRPHAQPHGRVQDHRHRRRDRPRTPRPHLRTLLPGERGKPWEGMANAVALS